MGNYFLRVQMSSNPKCEHFQRIIARPKSLNNIGEV